MVYLNRVIAPPRTPDDEDEDEEDEEEIDRGAERQIQVDKTLFEW